ncbi:UNVERIFIED_CONTAM: Golgin candidate 4 [Sesamum radiatum]|uniref:Golgin candidate 4 n=1 Tax=Sesamum radiatum TaxID=300843 RepID=A0AAW2VD18_SESRA
MPMWSSVANLKESLSKIALDVHDEDDEELPIYTSSSSDQFDNGNSVSERRISRNFTRSRMQTHSSIGNGFDSSLNHEIEQYKTQIKRLQESEAEIKALSVNYAALLKEKEDQISRLTEENGSLKQNLLTTNAALSAFKTVPKGTGDISPNRHNKPATRIRTSGSSLTNGVPKYDGLNNGTSLANSNELSDTIEDKSRSLAAMQATHEAQMKQMAVELDKERSKSAKEQKLNGSLQQELSSLKDDNNKMLNEMHKTRNELNQRISDIGKLQMELQGKNREETDGTVERLKEVISILEDENRNIKKEKDEFEAALKAIHSSPVRKDIPGDLDPSDKHPSSTVEALAENQGMQQSLRKLEKDLQETCKERDKALQELNRLKQHLLEKESEESEKMDEDSKIIDELQEINEHQRVQISRLEKALKQAIGGQEEIKMSNNNELKKAKETIDELNRKLASCMSTIDAKNMEVLNLQTALGQYYAEIEAKERLCEELSVAKEESARLSKQLKEAHQEAEASKREKEEILDKLSQAERMLAEGKNRVKKLEEDNEKLRRALEQSMTRLNRMSVDSDFLVDRLDKLKLFSNLKLERIVIKLLVTYFQRNHSKEVLDLMVRMLGFSDEDKQRIGLAQQGVGKGVVRGVLGLPGRLVGGILRSGSAEAHTTVASDSESFADKWVDFLLDYEQEKKESASAAYSSSPDYSTTGTASLLPDHRRNTAAVSDFRRPSLYLNENTTLSPSRGTFLQHEHSDSEFSTVPLTSSESNSQSSRLLPRY